MERTMRTGTFLCWLFGHCFLFTEREDEPEPRAIGGWKTYLRKFPVPFCVRCGYIKPKDRP